MQDWLGAIEDKSEALLQESGAGLHERTFTSDMNPGAGVSWPDLPDILGVGYGKPPPGSGDMIVFPNFVRDFDPEPSGILPEFGDMCPGSVACPCLHTETSAGSAPRQFLTSAAGDTSLSDDSVIHCLSTSAPLGTHFTSGGSTGARLFETDDMISCTQLLRLYALLPDNSVLNVCFGRDLPACLNINRTDMDSVDCKV